nr:GNAT family N-acetyltransferase [Candidatus Njordarchaeum guaymaensis]
MQDAKIHPLRKKDISFAYKMNKTEQWNDREEDLRRMLDYEPKGCFLAVVEGKPAGHVFTVNYGRLGWIGLLIVKAEYRRIGIGRLLMEKAKQYLLDLGVRTIKLEAVPEFSDLYRALGFVDEYHSLRFKGVYNKKLTGSSTLIVNMKEDMIYDIAEFDTQYFGADRAKVLSKLYQAYPELCLVSCSKQEILGYVMCRKAETGYKLGPWICNPENLQIATDLLIACMKRIGDETSVFVGVPATNESAIEILSHLGFTQYSKSIRMRFGEELKDDCIKGVFAIGGPMKG